MTKEMIEAIAEGLSERGLEFDEVQSTCQDLMDTVEGDSEACPGCGNVPGDGYTRGCNHPIGCGFFREAYLDAGGFYGLRSR